MIRDKIAPELRGMGFKGSGQSFTLPSNSHLVLPGFQKSTANTSEGIRFTVNVTAADKRAWSEAQGTRGYLPERPNANTFYGNFAWQVRIGQLLPGGDKWWTVSACRGWNKAGVVISGPQNQTPGR